MLTLPRRVSWLSEGESANLKLNIILKSVLLLRLLLLLLLLLLLIIIIIIMLPRGLDKKLMDKEQCYRW